MAQAKLISPVSRQAYERTKVAAYCRVSSNSADQLNSYAAQIRAYTKLIKSNDSWELVEIFADEGLSGMKAENRVEFQRMIEMCEHKQIDLIITKSVSRFARNVKEALEYVRKLKLLGIGVQFEKEGIYTLALGDEMLLNTFSAIAQEESKAISQNQRLSIVKRMERGEYVDSNAPYGFRLQDKKLEAFDREADVVRYIFQQYLSGWSTSEIARDLTEKGIQTKLGKEQWRSTKISYILSNERYVGDCRYQKTYRDTTVPFKQSKNRGQEDMNLKEAFRYQNKLQSFMDEAQGILDRDANVTKVENTYLRHKVMAEAEDETVLIAPETEYYEQITDIAKFLLYLLGEKDKLFAAIRKAKDALDIDMDSEVSLNATRQSIARTFKRMNDLRNSEQTISNGGTGYRFNAEGNQISYRCDVKRVTTINYDRNVIRTELGKLNKQADETSTKIDLCLVTSKVDYEPPFDVNSSFAEAFEAYTENARA